MKSKSMSELATEKIKADILSGKYKTGQKYLSEKELCQMLSVSRTTVREAIRTLCAIGYLENRPGKGAFVLITDDSELDLNAAIVVKFNKDSFLELTEVRLGLEPIAAKYAALRATEDDIITLYGLLSLFEIAFSQKNTSKMLELDEKIHTQIALATKNAVFIDIHQSMSFALRECKSKLFAIEGNGLNAISEHREVVLAISEHNAEKAYLTMKKHIENVSENIIAIVGEKN